MHQRKSIKKRRLRTISKTEKIDICEKYYFLHIILGEVANRRVYRFPVSRSNPRFREFLESCDRDGWENKETWEDETKVPKADWLALSIGEHSWEGFLSKFGDCKISSTDEIPGFVDPLPDPDILPSRVRDFSDLILANLDRFVRYREPVNLKDYDKETLKRCMALPVRVWVREKL